MRKRLAFEVHVECHTYSSTWPDISVECHELMLLQMTFCPRFLELKVVPDVPSPATPAPSDDVTEAATDNRQEKKIRKFSKNLLTIKSNPNSTASSVVSDAPPWLSNLTTALFADSGGGEEAEQEVQ